MGDNHYQYALDSNGDVIYIDEASPDEDFFCLVCNLKVIPKDQNEEWSRRHFVHADPEKQKRHGASDAYFNTKWFLFDLIKRKIAQHEDIYIVPKCPGCEEDTVLNALDDSEFGLCTYGEAEGKPVAFLYDPPHGLMVSPPAQSGALRKYYYGILYKGTQPYSIPPNFFNLYVKVIPDSFSYPLIEESDEIVADRTFGEVKPILALLKNGELFKVIEMVYSTDIPAKKENYYRENDIDVIRIHLGSFSQVERIQKMRDYLPLTFVSVTANKDRKKIEEAYLVGSDYEIKPHFENYYKMIGKPERIHEIIKNRETREEDVFDIEDFMEFQDKMINMPEEVIDKMKDLATQICDLCSEIEKNAEENGIDPDEFNTLLQHSPFMIDLSAKSFIRELDEYKQMKKES